MVGEFAEAFATHRTPVRPLSRVDEGVAAEVTWRGEGAGTHATLMRFVLWERRGKEDKGDEELEEKEKKDYTSFIQT